MPYTLIDFNKTWNVGTGFRKRPQNQIRPVGAALTHADRRTDMTRVIGDFHDIADVSKNIRKRKLFFIGYKKCMLKKTLKLLYDHQNLKFFTEKRTLHYRTVFEHIILVN